jgi:hypothetical protein
MGIFMGIFTENILTNDLITNDHNVCFLRPYFLISNYY